MEKAESEGAGESVAEEYMYALSSKIENAHWAEKTTTTRCGIRVIATTRCGIRETATTRNFVLWLFLNDHDAG